MAYLLPSPAGKLVWQFIDPENAQLLELKSYSERQYTV